jgi:hypothetical protein
MAKRIRKRKKTIFERARLRPAQLRTVADRRYGDAKALLETRSNERANGSMYMAGFVLECLLKAALLIEYPWLETTGHVSGLTEEKRRLWNLCYRSHALDEILDCLPRINRQLEAYDQRGGQSVSRAFKEIASQWAVFARYSPHSSTIGEAAVFLRKIEEIRRCLRFQSS